MDPQLVLFAIESAVKLGRKIFDVLIDETVERPLLLPVGELYANVAQNEALLFFARPENAALFKKGGPYFGYSAEERLLAYKTLVHVTARLDVPAQDLRRAVEIVGQLNAFRQLAPTHGARSPAQRIAGTVFEIGVDFFKVHPEALAKDSTARRVIQSFLEGIDETEFAEGAPLEIVGDILGAALRTVAQNTTVLTDDRRWQVMWGGITQAMITEFEGIPGASASDELSLRRFVERTAGSLVRGGLQAFSDELDLFLPEDGAAKEWVADTVSQVLGGVRENEDLFSAETVSVVFRSALAATAQNPELFADNQLLQKIIGRTAAALSTTSAQQLFSGATAGLVMRESMQILADHVPMLLDPGNPREELLALALEGIAQSLSGTLIARGNVKDLFSGKDLVALTKVVLLRVAQHPEELLGEKATDAKRTPLAQVIGSVAGALGTDPRRLVNAETFNQLVQLALQAALRNPGKWLHLKTTTARTNLLHSTIEEIVAAATTTDRSVVTRDVFLEIVAVVLPLVSSHIDAAQEGIVQEGMTAVMKLAAGELQDRIDGNNIALLIARVLRALFEGELNLSSAAAVESFVRQVLKSL